MSLHAKVCSVLSWFSFFDTRKKKKAGGVERRMVSFCIRILLLPTVCSRLSDCEVSLARGLFSQMKLLNSVENRTQRLAIFCIHFSLYFRTSLSENSMLSIPILMVFFFSNRWTQKWSNRNNQKLTLLLSCVSYRSYNTIACTVLREFKLSAK